MKSINFRNSFKEYAVNGDESKVIRIKLDPEMPERINQALAEIDELKSKVNEDNIAEMGRKFGEITDKTFGTDICTPAFGGENPFSVVDGGRLLLEAFFEAFLPILEEDLKALKIRPEVKKYL